MKMTRTIHQTTDSEDIKSGGFLLLLSVAVILSFTVVLWRAGWFSQNQRIDNGTVQETIGYSVQVLGRFDQDRQARLQQQWDRTVQQLTAFETGRPGRLQEILGQSIAHTARMILMEQERLRAAVTDAKTELERFNRERPARWQEKLGGAVLAAYRRAPEGGPLFRAALQRETNRLREMDKRLSRRLSATLAVLTDRQAEFPNAIPGMYGEAIQSAHRSARMFDESHREWTRRILTELNAELSWQRRPEDYIQMVGVVREILAGFRGVGGFAEYGWPALAGVLVAMGWLGSTIPKSPIVDMPATSGGPVADLSKRKAA